MNFREIFVKGNAGLGWAVLWRLALILVPLNFLSELAATEAGTNPAGAAAMLLLVPVGNNVYLVPIAIPIMLFAWNWVGKYVMDKKLGIRPGTFVGWSLYWRTVLLQLAAIFLISLVFIPLTLLARSAGDRTQLAVIGLAGLVLLPALIFWTLNVIGFVLRRVARLVPITDTLSAVPDEGGAVLVRSYQTLFNRSRYGMNWLPAAAYVVTGLLATLAWPLVDMLFGSEFNLGPVSLLPIFFLSWVIAGAALAWFLHYLRSGWQVVLAFAVTLIATRVLQSVLMGFVDETPSLPLPDAQGLTARAAFAVLYATGLLAGIRLIGPTILGFGISLSLATLIHSQLVFPMVLSAFQHVPISDFWSPHQSGVDVVLAIFDAGVSGVAFWWACDWHLRRRGLRLTQRGFIEPVVSTPVGSVARPQA